MQAEHVLRDRQRAAFRAGDENVLLGVADTIATVVDTLLITRGAIDATLDTASELRAWASTARTGRSLADASARISQVLEVAERVNRWYAAFQLARAALDLVAGGRTASAQGHAAVSAIATTVSAGGTLLSASAGFTLYSNIYIGPMVNACLTALRRLEDTMSRTQNRSLIQLREFDMVNWSIEPGGRPVFDYMLRLCGSCMLIHRPG